MGLFTPGWLKSYDKADKRLSDKVSVNDCERILMEPALYGNKCSVINKAVGKLRNHKDGDKARSAMYRILESGPNACIRCCMGYYLKGKEGLSVLRSNFPAAIKEQWFPFIGSGLYWVEFIENPSDVWEIYDQVDKSGKETVVSNATCQKFLIDIALGGEKALADTAFKNLRFTQDQCARILRESRNEDYLDKAIIKSTIENRDLLAPLAYSGNRRAQDRLLEIDPDGFASKFRDRVDDRTIKKMTLAGAGFLETLAEKGNECARKQLVYLDPDRYGVLYPGKLDESKMIRGIEEGIYSDKALEDIIRSLDQIDQRNPKGQISWLALERITDKDILEKLLYSNFHHDHYSPVEPMEKHPDVLWKSELVDRLSKERKILARYLNNNNTYHHEQVDCKILNIMGDEKLTLKCALSRKASALEAAKMLGDRYIGDLRRSENKKVREYADRRWVEASAEDLTGEEAIERLRTLLDLKTDGEQFLKISRWLENDEQRREIIGEIMYKYKPFGDKTEAVTERLLADVKDGEALLELCMTKHVDKTVRNRLHDLIDGTPLEQKMIDRAVEDLMHSPVKGWGNMHFVANYYDMHVYKAAWQFGGEKYIKNLLAVIEVYKEIGEVRQAADLLQKIYKEVPLIRPVVKDSVGKTFTKHDDFVDEHCMGNNRNKQEYFTLNL